MKIEVKIKKIGGALGIILPAEVKRKINLKEGEILKIEIKKIGPNLFGKVKKKILFREEDRVNVR